MPADFPRRFDALDPDAPLPRSTRPAGVARALAILALGLCGVAGFAGGDDGLEDVAAASTGHAAAPEPARAAPLPSSASAGISPETQLTARRLIADVEMARTALAADLVSAARQHVSEAVPLAQRLLDQAAADGPRAATASARWIPVQDEQRVVRTPGAGPDGAGAGRVIAADAHSIQTRRAVDAGRVLAHLRVAERSLAASDAAAATRELDAAAGSIASQTEVRDLPLARVHDDLDLARELSARGDDDAANDALDFARAALADAELADVALARNVEAIAMRREIRRLGAQLDARRPGALHALGAALERDAVALGAWLRAHLQD
jgi:hypothetical protein